MPLCYVCCSVRCLLSKLTCPHSTACRSCLHHRAQDPRCIIMLSVMTYYPTDLLFMAVVMRRNPHLIMAIILALLCSFCAAANTGHALHAHAHAHARLTHMHMCSHCRCPEAKHTVDASTTPCSKQCRRGECSKQWEHNCRCGRGGGYLQVEVLIFCYALLVPSNTGMGIGEP